MILRSAGVPNLPVPQPKGSHVAENEVYEPSPDERSRNQVALYEATDGAAGNTLEDRPKIILTHTGATSGLTRTTPLMEIEHDGSYGVIASNGGAAKAPLWVREVFGAERDQWWTFACATYPKFAHYREIAGRDIPLYVLEPMVA